jgi:Zn-dependent protease
MSLDEDGRPPREGPLIELLPPALPIPGSWEAGPRPARPRERWGLAVLLFLLTLLTTTASSPTLLLWSRTNADPQALPFLTPGLLARIVHDPAWLKLGLAFALPALAILLAHELGHYLACRWYRLPATPPFFLPLPAMMGTLGAFIRIRAPIDTKRELFDVGIAGPLAGFVTLLPFLVYGVAHSRPAPVVLAAGQSLLVPGRCLAIELAIRLIHGPLPPGWSLDLHPFAFAAWFGLLATAINLIPIGQLDGGHILYAVSPRWQRRLALPAWLVLAVLGFTAWQGWLVWCALILLMGLRHPPVRDERKPLDGPRKVLAAIALVILVLSFVPRGLDERIGPVPAARTPPPGSPARR